MPVGYFFYISIVFIVHIYILLLSLTDIIRHRCPLSYLPNSNFPICLIYLVLPNSRIH